MAPVESPVAEFVCRGVTLDRGRTLGSNEDPTSAFWQVCTEEPIEREEGKPQSEAFDEAEHVHLARLINTCLVQEAVRRIRSRQASGVSGSHGLFRLFGSTSSGPSRPGEKLGEAQHLLLVVI